LLKIGLTGGIGSGKTTAGDYFAEFGAEVIDTDLLSRELAGRNRRGLRRRGAGRRGPPRPRPPA
jgi:dephospho-CoA kinase